MDVNSEAHSERSGPRRFPGTTTGAPGSVPAPVGQMATIDHPNRPTAPVGITTLPAVAQSQNDVRQAELLPGETVLWTGRPVRYLVFRGYDLLVVPCGLALLYLEVSELLTKTSGEGRVSTAGLVGKGVYMACLLGLVLGLYLIRMFFLRGTRYTVTNQRVLVRTRVLGLSRVRFSHLWNLEPRVSRVRDDGTGTLQFEDTRTGASYYTPTPIPAGRPVTLYHIPDVQRVADLVAAVRREQDKA